MSRYSNGNIKYKLKAVFHILTDENSKILIRRETPAVANNSSSRSNTMLEKERTFLKQNACKVKANMQQNPLTLIQC